MRFPLVPVIQCPRLAVDPLAFDSFDVRYCQLFRMANHILNDPIFEHALYDPLVTYGRTKTANVLFAVAFDQRRRARSRSSSQRDSHRIGPS